MIYAILGLPFDTVQDIGWALVHFIWQGLVLASALQLVLRLCKGPVARHNWSLVTLAAMAIAPIATFLIIHRHGVTAAPLGAITESAFQSIGGIAPEFTPSSLPESIPVSWTDWLVMFWLAGIAVLSARSLGGWYVAESLRHRDTFPLSQDLLQRCRVLQQRLAISTPVQFLQSRKVRGLAVVGWFRPTILIPISAITGLSPQYLDALITHELAHIRRFDTFTNLLLISVETILFYHPAVWWVGRRVRIEREHCCDDVAVAICGDATAYVEALMTMETWKATPVFALAANGGKLKQRVARLLGIVSESRRFSLSAVIGVAFLGLLAAGCAIAQNKTQTTNQVFAIRAVVERSLVERANVNCMAATTTAAELACMRAGLRPPPPPPPSPPPPLDADLVPMRIGMALPAELWLKREGEVTHDMVTDAHATTDMDGNPIVEYSLSPEGSERLAALSRANIGHQLAIVVDGEVVSAPRVVSEIGGGKCGSAGTLFIGNTSAAEARAIAKAIKPSKAHRLTPSPGTEASLRRFIEAKQRGESNYEDMTPKLAAVDREQSPRNVPLVQSYGRLKSLTFKTVDGQCMNVFEATFEKRSAEFRIGALTPEGKVGFINWRMVPTPEQEAAIKQRIAAGNPAPERKALLLQEIEGEQNGDLKPEIMTPFLLATATRIWPTIQENNKKLGKFQGLEFVHVDQRGFDDYTATYEHGHTLYRVGPLTADHKLQAFFWGGFRATTRASIIASTP